VQGIVAGVSLFDLNRHCRFPDWLGYIGIVLAYTEKVEQSTPLLTKKLVPQFEELSGKATDSDFRQIERNESGDWRLRWQDLERFEGRIRMHTMG